MTLDIHHRLYRIEANQADMVRLLHLLSYQVTEVRQVIGENSRTLKQGAAALKKMNEKPHEALSKKKLVLAAVMFLTGMVLLTNDLKEVTAFLQAFAGLLKSL